MALFRGVATAITTPFDKKGIDWVALRQQIEWQIDSGVEAIVVLGTTGESSTVSNEERAKLIAMSVDIVAGRVPVIVGTGSNDTAKAIFYSQQAEVLGADGLLIVTPYYNKCTQNGLIAHYTKIALKVGLPIILYNVPSRTNVNILPKTLGRLANIDNIVAIKDASGDLLQMQEYCNVAKDLDIYCGDDALIIPYFAQSAKGVISVLSNILPKEMVAIGNLCKNNDFERARDAYSAVFFVNKAMLTEVNPIGVKTAMQLLGRDSGILRPPLGKMSRSHTMKLKRALEQYWESLE